MNTPQVTKQCVGTWQVTAGGKHVAWIVKARDGVFTVTWKDDPTPYRCTSFADAKEMAVRVASVV